MSCFSVNLHISTRQVRNSCPKLISQAPARPGVCASPERAYYRQASQEALKKSAACITCPAARKRAPFIQDYLSGNRKVVHLFPLRSMLEAKAFLLSPADLRVVISLKHTKQKGAMTPRWAVMASFYIAVVCYFSISIF